jgi:pimeloyl-ACP methyl ester carboxylesterase
MKVLLRSCHPFVNLNFILHNFLTFALQNAGHLLQTQRPYLYAALTSLHPTTHLIAFSYRGFHRSTGTPNEPNLIKDGVNVVSYAISSLRIPSSRIGLVGESLGTAVASGVAAHFGTVSTSENMIDDADETTPLSTSPNGEIERRSPIDFATVVLVASFYDLRTLLLDYRIAGQVPILGPLVCVPPVQKFFANRMQETWDTKGRLGSLVASALQGDAERRCHIQFLHALDDTDIPCKLSEKSYEHVKSVSSDPDFVDGEVVEYVSDSDKSVWKWCSKGGVRIDLRIVRKGGESIFSSLICITDILTVTCSTQSFGFGHGSCRCCYEGVWVYRCA